VPQIARFIEDCENGLRTGRVRIHNANLFVISGGPGAGKTTVIRELAKFGYSHSPEVARQIIQEQVQNGGVALPWKDREAYTQLMLQRSIESYLKHAPYLQPIFSDRGIPDTLCYARLIGLKDEEVIRTACKQYRYAPIVFLAPPWKEIYQTDSERKQDFAEAERTFGVMTTVYTECGYTVLELPRSTPLARALFVLETLQKPLNV
jgi:predicted ATPase